MEGKCKERKYVSMIVSILLPQVHDHSTHHFNNIFNESFKFFLEFTLSEKKRMWEKRFCKRKALF